MMGYHHGPASFWMGRHRGRHKFRDFAAGWTTEGGFGGGRFRVGRKLGSEELQLVVLALLAENPSHGYELIKVLEERSSGFYSPSPGMIYPALTYLEEVNYATVASEGAKKLYRITAEGRAYLDQNRSVADTILGELERIGRRMKHVRRAFAGYGPSDDEAADDSANPPDELRRARRTLRGALQDKQGCSAEEAARIAEILRRATAEILGGK